MEQIPEPFLRQVQIDPVFLGPGDIVDVFHQPGQAGELVSHNRVGGIIPVHDPVLETIEVDREHR